MSSISNKIIPPWFFFKVFLKELGNSKKQRLIEKITRESNRSISSVINIIRLEAKQVNELKKEFLQIQNIRILNFDTMHLDKDVASLTDLKAIKLKCLETLKKSGILQILQECYSLIQPSFIDILELIKLPIKSIILSQKASYKACNILPSNEQQIENIKVPAGILITDGIELKNSIIFLNNKLLALKRIVIRVIAIIKKYTNRFLPKAFILTTMPEIIHQDNISKLLYE